MADDAVSLRNALCEASRAGILMMAEQRIAGRELTLAVLGGRVLPPVEIIPRDGFYDYENKYIPGRTEELCPAPVGEKVIAELAAITAEVFGLLGLRAYARADYMLDSEGRLWFLEINTLPGMTPTSLLPQEAQSAGISYDELCDIIVHSAME